MMNINIDKILNETDKLNNDQIKAELMMLINVYEGKIILDSKKVDEKIDYLLSLLFGLPLMSKDNVMMPISFLDSNIGNFLMHLKYNQSLYDLKQFANISGYSFVYLQEEVRASRLHAKYYISKNSAINYLNKKGKK